MALSSAQTGMALISALLLMTAAAMLLTQIQRGHVARFEALALRQNQQVMEEHARAARSWALRVLWVDGRQSATDHQAELWANSVDDLALPGGNGRVGGRLADAQSRINVTNLLATGEPARHAATHIERLALLAGLEAQVAADLPRRLRTLMAELSLAKGRYPNWVWLGEQAGLDDATVDRLGQWLVVLPDVTRVNVNTLSAPVLRALLPSLSAGVASQVSEGIARTPLLSVQDLRARLPDGFGDLPSASLSVESQYFLLELRVERDSQQRRECWLIHRPIGQAPSVLPSAIGGAAAWC